MIDIHTHLLPYIDDGSPDMESSLRLLEEAAKNGTTTMFLTPHYIQSRNYVSPYEENQKVFESFVQEAKNRHINVELYLGTEIYYRLESVRDLKAQRVVPLGKTNRVLLEFHETEEQEDVAEAIHNMKTLGYVPIIAHIERYSYLHRLEDLQIIKKMGAMIQVNASSVIGKSGRADQKTILKWMKLGLIDFVASDIHVFRQNDMVEAYRLVEKKLGKVVAERMFHNTAIFS
jgi:protein-tyrosine phosphatase